MTPAEYFELTHFTDALMTPLEISELPKAWAIGGDGGMGDIGFQNVSKVVLQNRPNVKLLMLDTQVYSNTGGQNSDSSLMTGGFDMNQVGAATQGKLIEKKGLAEIFTSGHGSPYVAQVSMANAPKFYKAVLDALEYRGTAFLQTLHHVPARARRRRRRQHGAGAARPRLAPDAGVLVQPGRGETYREAIEIKGNPAHDRDWWEKTNKATGEKFRYTVAHYAATEARFRPHLRRGGRGAGGDAGPAGPHARPRLAGRRGHAAGVRRARAAFVPDFGVAMRAEDDDRDACAATRCPGRWCCCASSAGSRGACCRARPAWTTWSIVRSAPCGPGWRRASWRARTSWREARAS